MFYLDFHRACSCSFNLLDNIHSSWVEFQPKDGLELLPGAFHLDSINVNCSFKPASRSRHSGRAVSRSVWCQCDFIPEAAAAPSTADGSRQHTFHSDARNHLRPEIGIMWSEVQQHQLYTESLPRGQLRYLQGARHIGRWL